MSALTCRICGNAESNSIITAKEMMFGFGGEFGYILCSKCGCLQIKEIPDNISKYYPEEYYSYGNSIAELNTKKSFADKFKKDLLRYYLGDDNLMGRMLSYKYKSPYQWLKKNMVTFDSKILDVGSGEGKALRLMANSGFTNLTGVDPFIEKDITYDDGVRIYKEELGKLDGEFDFIMLHHSFEHMSEPLNVLKNLYRLLKPKHYVLIRIPVADSFAFKKYKENWVQLDAPRHFFLHTKKSMEILSEQSGFNLDDVVYDSTELQFTGSEKYLKSIPLIKDEDMFNEKQVKEYLKQTDDLNKQGLGDQACFYLYKE